MLIFLGVLVGIALLVAGIWILTLGTWVSLVVGCLMVIAVIAIAAQWLGELYGRDEMEESRNEVNDIHGWDEMARVRHERHMRHVNER